MSKGYSPNLRQGLLLIIPMACGNLGSETQKMQMLAETMVAALRKGNEGCFHVEIRTILKRTSLRKLIKNLQKSAPAA